MEGEVLVLRVFQFKLIQDLRKGLSPTFTSSKIKGMLDLLDGGVNQMIDHLELVTKKDSLVNVKDVFQKMALDVIARSILINNFAFLSDPSPIIGYACHSLTD